MQRTILICIISFCSLQSALSQKATLKGKVTDGTTQLPLSGVHIVYGEGHGTITSSEGIFSMEIPAGTFLISFHYLGYQKYEQKVSVAPGKTIILNVELEPTFSEIDELVVSPSRTEQKISELSVSTILIKPAQLIENHILKPEEIMNQTQGIEVMDSQASIRGGSGYAYGVGSRVLILIDGYPTLAADAGNIKWGFLPLENLSQIEVIKGASSVLYGSSALNGIINFRTQEAAPEGKTQYSITTGIFDKPKNANWYWWSSPRMFSQASFSFSQRHHHTGIGIGARLLLDNGYRRLNDEKLGSINLKIKQYSAKIEGLSYGIQVNTGYQQRIDFLLWEDADTGALRQNESTASRLKAFMMTFDPSVSFNRGGPFRHDLRLRYQTTQNRLPQNSNNNSDAHSVFAEYQISWKILKNLGIIAGGSGTYIKILSPFHGNHTTSNIAGFMQLDYKAWTRLNLQAGIRIEHNRLDEEADKTIPIFRTGLNYRIARFTFIRASFGQGYRYPSIAERFASTTLGSIRIFPNQEIQPESGWGTELGIKQGISFRQFIGHVDLALFYTRNTDLIEYIFGIYPDPETHEGDYGFRASNTEHSRVYGFEIESSLNRDFGPVAIQWRAGYTFMNPVEFDINTGKNTDVFLKYRRKHAVNITTVTTWKKFDLGINLYYRSKILNIDNVFLNPLTRESLLPGFYEYWQQDNKDYGLIDGFFTYHFNTKIALSFGVKNITNTEYMGRPGDIRPHRNYTLQLRGNF
jgi:iron complex outermembrane receptor protein